MVAQMRKKRKTENVFIRQEDLAAGPEQPRQVRRSRKVKTTRRRINATW